MWVQLHVINNNRPVVINTDFICAVYPSMKPDSTYDGHTYIQYGGIDKTITVQESYEDVIDLISRNENILNLR